MNLYEINQELERLIEEAIDPETGEIKAEYEEAFDKLNMTKADKLEGYAMVIKNKTTFRKAIEVERKLLQAREKALSTSIDYLKFKLKNGLEGEKIKTAKVSVYYSSRKSLEVDENFDPADYYENGNADNLIERQVGYSIPKTKIAEKIEKGVSVAWAKLVTKTAIVVR